jgi:hypothetical protein
MNDVALAVLQLCFTSMLIVAVVQRKQRRCQRRKAPYHVRKRRGPPRKERPQWSYSSWHGDEFRKNYRMDKQHFKDLAELVRDDLPGGSELSRKRQKAASGGNPICIRRDTIVHGTGVLGRRVLFVHLQVAPCPNQELSDGDQANKCVLSSQC